jgi:hypothetical protein
MSPTKTTKKEAFAPLSVELIEGEMFRAFVGSRSTAGKKHLVDLEEWNWNGKCDCINFECRLQPKVKRGVTPCDGLRCSHIRRFRSYFLDEMLPKLAKALKAKGQI